MTEQQLTLGECLKRSGQSAVEANNRDWLDLVRAIAVIFCQKNGSVSTDDLREWCDAKGYQPSHRNAWGAIFRGSEWETCRYEKSRYEGNHARRITVWRWRGSL